MSNSRQEVTLDEYLSGIKPDTTKYESKSDEGTAVETKISQFKSTVRTRNMVEAPTKYGVYPAINMNVPLSLKMDFSRILNKPFFIKDVQWGADVAFSSIATIVLPQEALINDMLRVPFKTAARYRTKSCIIAQVTGTPQHQGTILLAAVPHLTISPDRNTVNSLLQAPHVFLSANESTPVCLEVPFYSNTKLKTCGLPDANVLFAGADPNYADVIAMVINPLSAGASAIQTVRVAFHYEMRDAEFYVPDNSYTAYAQSAEAEPQKCWERPEARVCVANGLCCCVRCLVERVAPCFAEAQSGPAISSMFDNLGSTLKTITADFIDKGREVVRRYTGLHNPNNPTVEHRVVVSHRNMNNTVESATHAEKLDPFDNHDRVVSEPTFYTQTDEMMLNCILSKPQYLSTFSVASTDPSRTLLFSRPITPFQEKMSALTPVFSAPLTTFAYMSRFWRGTIKLHIQSSMTNFHCCKLMVVKDYSHRKDALTLAPSFLDVVGLQAETLEFSAGGQVQTIELPFCSEYEELMCLPHAGPNAMSHGIYYIYLAQSLAYSASVPTTVSFNVYISAGDDFNFYGYSVNRFEMVASGVSLGLQDSIPTKDQSVAKIESEKKAKLHERVVRAVAQSCEDSAAPTTVLPSCQKGLLNSCERAYIHDNKFRPIVSVRDFIRRYQRTRNYIGGANETANYVCVVPLRFLLRDWIDSTKVGPARVVRKFFLGATGGLKIKAYVYGAAGANMHYLPPGYPADGMTAGTSIWGAAPVEPTLLANANVVYPQYRTPSSGYIVDDYSPTVALDSGLVTNNLGITHEDAGTPGSNALSTSCVVLEAVIPQMNNCEFMGSEELFKAYTATPNASDDYGTIIVAYNTVFPDGTHAVTDPFVNFSIAYADEARLGFQVFSPPCKPDLVGTAWGTPYLNEDGSLPSYEYSMSAPYAYVG